MSEKPVTLLELIGKELGMFSVVEYTEVFKVNDDGHKSRSIGFLKSDDIARAYAGIQIDANWFRTERVLLLTDGEVGFVLSRVNNPSLASVDIIKDEKALLEVKEKALNKLSPEEKKVLGLG